MPLRRLFNRLVGTGPWRIASFAQIAAARTDEHAHGVHRPESFAGIVHAETDTGFAYSPALSLLGQPATGELLPDGPRYLGRGLCPAALKRLFTLSDASIAGRDGVVYCPRSRTAVAETIRCWRRPATAHPLLGATRFPPPQSLPGISLSLATLDGEGFYHFLLESLPRLWLARNFLSSVDHVLVSGRAQPSHTAWLARAGIPADKIVWLDPLAHYRCEHLLFADRAIANYQPTAWVRDALHSLLRPAVSASPRRWLWISRAGAASRHLVWEDALLTRFPRFEKHLLGSLPPTEQMALFADAAVAAGPHGAGLANLLFAAPGARLAEFFPDSAIQPLYARIAQVAGGHAAWATVDFSAPTDLDRVTAALASFLPA